MEKEQPRIFESMLHELPGRKAFQFWQAGGGFDRNLWSRPAIHNSIRYIEGNPVRAGLVQNPEEWEYSSAYARGKGIGLIPDEVEVYI